MKTDANIREMSDFTLYSVRRSANEVERALQSYQQDNKPRSSYECKSYVWDESAALPWFAEGRILACRCYEGAYWSLTLRKERDSRKKKSPEKYLNKDSEQIIGPLSKLIFGEEAIDKHGLIVVAGRTGVGKSLIARGLIEKYMKARQSSRCAGIGS